MEKENLFKWKHYQPDIILLTVRWYLRGSVAKFLNIKRDERFVTNYYATINNFCNSLHVEKQESDFKLLFF
ncbi:hypothetical protein ABEY53_19810, partial [Bacillus mycoides]